MTDAHAFRSMDDYPWRDYRDAEGKWHFVEGPFVELKLENGRIVMAQYRGMQLNDGGEAWAFWALIRGKLKPIGTAEPEGWRLYSTIERLSELRARVTAQEDDKTAPLS